MDSKYLYLWNPSTGKSKKLPDLKVKLKKRYPKCCLFRFGFGYDEKNDDYKVVGIFCACHGDLGTVVCESEV